MLLNNPTINITILFTFSYLHWERAFARVCVCVCVSKCKFQWCRVWSDALSIQMSQPFDPNEWQENIVYS